MIKILTLAGAALALSCLTATPPAQAQAVFESIYTQPVEMVDGMNVGARISLAPRLGAAAGMAAQKCRAGVACGRRRGAHSGVERRRPFVVRRSKWPRSVTLP